jgi:probable F420-dependent oxidoreductase
MKLSVNLFSAGAGGLAQLLDLGRMLEELGYDQLDFGDHITVARTGPNRPTIEREAMAALEPFVAVAAVASVTRRIGLGTGVLVLPQRQPALVAKQAATLDFISGGRLRLGVGVGWQAAEFESLGVPFAERGARMEEAIELLRLFWTQPAVTFSGRFYQAEAMAVAPPPLRPGGPPVWLGGSSAAALRRVGRVADGWLAVGEPLEIVPEKLSLIREAAAQADRDPAAIGLQMLLTDVSSPRAVAQQAVAWRALGFEWLALAISDDDLAVRDREWFASVKQLVDQEANDP